MLLLLVVRNGVQESGEISELLRIARFRFGIVLLIFQN